jgi:hypothetical protein
LFFQYKNTHREAITQLSAMHKIDEMLKKVDLLLQGTDMEFGTTDLREYYEETHEVEKGERLINVVGTFLEFEDQGAELWSKTIDRFQEICDYLMGCYDDEFSYSLLSYHTLETLQLLSYDNDSLFEPLRHYLSKIPKVFKERMVSMETMKTPVEKFSFYLRHVNRLIDNLSSNNLSENHRAVLLRDTLTGKVENVIKIFLPSIRTALAALDSLRNDLMKVRLDERMMTFGMASHHRLGENSIARLLSKDILSMIRDLLDEVDSSPARTGF